MRSHFGRTATTDKVSVIFYWYIIVKNVAEYIRSCDECQKQREIRKDVANKLHCIPVPETGRR